MTYEVCIISNLQLGQDQMNLPNARNPAHWLHDLIVDQMNRVNIIASARGVNDRSEEKGLRIWQKICLVKRSRKKILNCFTQPL